MFQELLAIFMNILSFQYHVDCLAAKIKFAMSYLRISIVFIGNMVMSSKVV